MLTAFLCLCRQQPVSIVRLSARAPHFLRCNSRIGYRSLQTTVVCRSTFGSRMRLVQFEWNGRIAVGVEMKEGGDIVDVAEVDPTVPRNMTDFIKGGQPNLLAAEKAINSGHFKLKRENINLLAPITNPEKILCVGMNYKDHCEEQGVPVPEEPVIFSKFNNSIVGPNCNIPYPKVTQQLDWEVELVIVIGKTAKDVPEEKAMDYVFGFTIAHDVSARDWQFKNGGQFLLGKSMDGFCPLGPAIVMKEDLKDPHNLNMWTRVNGVVKQDSNTKQLVFKTQELIAFISRFLTLKPGDIILTGTPPGVGVFRKPPEFLKKGDVVEVEIEDIGTLINTVV